MNTGSTCSREKSTLNSLFYLFICPVSVYPLSRNLPFLFHFAISDRFPSGQFSPLYTLGFFLFLGQDVYNTITRSVSLLRYVRRLRCFPNSSKPLTYLQPHRPRFILFHSYYTLLHPLRPSWVLDVLGPPVLRVKVREEKSD